MNCQNYVACPQSPVLLGFDSTVPDVPVFIGLGFGPITPPPLNWQFQRTTAFAIRTSTLSQQDADEQSVNAAIYDAQSGWVNPGGVPPIEWESGPESDWSFHKLV
jgi:hypothetical protein